MVNTGALLTSFAALASFTSLLYKPVVIRLGLFGVFRRFNGIENIHGHGLKVFDDTYGCEDLHYYEPTNVIYGLAEEKRGSRLDFFPPLVKFNTSTELGRAHFFMIIPENNIPVRLEVANFTGPFVAHGFDIWADPDDQTSLYFIVVNHLPNPVYSILQDSPEVPQARSQIEIFHHAIGTHTVGHQRSVRHPLIRTPNDILITDKDNFYVTNDHFFRDGTKRMAEDLGHIDFGAWSDIIHVSVSDPNSKDPTTGFTAQVAIEGLQNPNGLGHGRTKNEFLLGRASAGIVHTMSPSSPSSPLLNITDTLQFASTIDNPVYFRDPFVKETGSDASGFVIAGLSLAATFPDAPKHPSLVWLARPANGTGHEGGLKAPLRTWQHDLIFQDDGDRISTASAAVLVAIPPGANGGKKQAWLFVAGFLAEGVVRTRVDL